MTTTQAGTCLSSVCAAGVWTAVQPLQLVYHVPVALPACCGAGCTGGASRCALRCTEHAASLLQASKSTQAGKTRALCPGLQRVEVDCWCTTVSRRLVWLRQLLCLHVSIFQGWSEQHRHAHLHTKVLRLPWLCWVSFRLRWTWLVHPQMRMNLGPRGASCTDRQLLCIALVRRRWARREGTCPRRRRSSA